MATVSGAIAWPFVTRPAGGGGTQSFENNYAAVQTDSDRPLELATGTELFQLSVTGNRTLSTLPDFDHTPYNAAVSVRFEDGRVATGDIDGDGDIDMIRSARLYYENGISPEKGRLVTCINNGDGTWSRGWSWVDNITNSQVPALHLADLDRDGDLDFIEGYGSVRIHWNPGNGNFSAAPTTYYTNQFAVTGERGVEFAVADFDGNGWQDIAVFYGVPGMNPDVPNWLTGRLGLLSNTGGTFTASTVATLVVANEFLNADSADLDADGRPDLVASSGSGLRFYRNTGAGFAASVVISTDSIGNFELADVNEDRVLDVVHTNDATGAGWLRGLGNGSFAASQPLGSNPQSSSPGLAVADYDGDGDHDILLHGGAVILDNTAIHPATAASVVEWTSTSPTGAVDLTVGDLNHDGKQDLIAADGGGKRLLWYSGNGTGLNLQFPINTLNLAPASVAAGDFNGDGWTDLTWTTPNLIRQALSTTGTGLLWSFTDITDDTPGLETVFVLNSSGIKYTHPSQSQPLNLTGPDSGITQLAAADWNADGRTDILYADGGGVTLIQTGSFITFVPLLTGRKIQDLVIMDLNADRLPDAVAAETDGTLHLIYNTSNQFTRTITATASLDLVPTQGATAFRYTATNRGRVTSQGAPRDDAYAAPSWISLRFRRATFDGTNYVPSATVLTQTEVGLLIDTVSLEVNGTTAASAAPSSITNGIYHLTLSAAGRAAAKVIAANTSSTHSVRVRLKNSAGASGIPRFFVEFSAASPWAALDGNNTASPTPLTLNGTADLPRSLITVSFPTALDTWRFNSFGSYDTEGTTANGSDPDHDGVANLVEYFTGTDPEVSEPALNAYFGLTILPVTDPQLPVKLRLFGTATALADPKVRVTIQAATNSPGSWTTFSTRTGGGAWTGTIPTVLPPSGGRSNIFFTSSIVPQNTPKFFVRLKVEELP